MRGVQAVALGLLVLAALSVLHEDATAERQAAAAERKVVLIQGFTSQSGCSGIDFLAIFGDVIAALKAQTAVPLDNNDFLGLSYSGSYCDIPGGNSGILIPNYAATDTCWGLAQARQRLLALLDHYPTADFDLIGHSMGGVLAAHLVASLAPGDPLLSHIRSVTALDSPLQGLTGVRLIGARLTLTCLGVSGQSADDMAADSPYMVAIRDRSTAGKAPFTTVRDDADTLVPAEIAYLSGAWLDRLFHDDCGQSSHGCVLQNPIALQAVSDAVTTAGAPPEGLAASHWPMSRHDPSRTAYNRSEAALAPPLALRWQLPLAFLQTGQPVVSGARLFFEGVRGPASAQVPGLFAYNARTGAAAWAAAGQGACADQASVGEGGAESPAVFAGKVYYSGQGLLTALRTADGATSWCQGASQNVSPLASGGLVYAVQDPQGLAGYDPATGNLVRPCPAAPVPNRSPARGHGAFYYAETPADGANALAMDDVTCLVKWQRPEARRIATLLDSGVVYVTGEYLTGTGTVDAVDAVSGETLWSFSIAGAFTGSPALAEGALYAGSESGTLYALDTDPAPPQRVLWTFSAGGPFRSSPAVANGVVYAGSDDGRVYALDAASGASLWSYETAGSVNGSLVVADGMLYAAGTSPGGPTLYAFELDSDADGAGDSLDRDDDGDGHADAKELEAGSNPLAPASTPEVCDAADNDADTLSDEGYDLNADTLPDCSQSIDTDGDTIANTSDPDDDNDGFSDAAEDFMATNSLDPCPDSRSEDAWPPDIDRDGDSDIGDVLRFAPVILTQAGQPNYDRRFDFTTDSAVNVGDIIRMGPAILTSCG